MIANKNEVIQRKQTLTSFRRSPESRIATIPEGYIKLPGWKFPCNARRYGADRAEATTEFVRCHYAHCRRHDRHRYFRHHWSYRGNAAVAGRRAAGVVSRRPSRAHRSAQLRRAIGEPTARRRRLHLYPRGVWKTDGLLIRLVIVSRDVFGRDCVFGRRIYRVSFVFYSCARFE